MGAITPKRVGGELVVRHLVIQLFSQLVKLLNEWLLSQLISQLVS